MKRVDVVAGIIFDASRERVLLALRKPDQHQGNRWEFPGGKIESGESQADALKRELFEEIGLSVEQSSHRRTLEHHYVDKHVRLHFWDITVFTGKPQACEGQQLKWVVLSDLAGLRFPEANQAIVDELVTISDSTV
ncbi:MAG: 8-oxo-dGTP diphosphatase MutT [Granulosicoccus sp.]